MSSKTREILENKVADKTVEINNIINKIVQPNIKNDN